MKNSKFIFSTLFLAVFGLWQAFIGLSTWPLWNMESSTAPTTIELTLSKAEEMALDGNPRIHAADKRADAAGKQTLQTLAPADPMFMIERDAKTEVP